MRYILTVILLSITITISDSTALKPSFVRSKANFLVAFKIILAHEGGLANHPMDKGGKTYAGITYKWNKSWNGWKNLDNKVLLDYWVLDYYLHIWVTEGFDQLENQAVANYLFDTRINISRKNCIKLLNKKLNLNVKYTKRWVTQRLDTINLDLLRDHRIEYYKYLLFKNPSQRVFIRGWINRSKIDV